MMFVRSKFWLCLVIPLFGLLPAEVAGTREPLRNGFALSRVSVPLDEILPGGPARDGIPALSGPEVIPADRAPWRDDERIIGIEINGTSRAYPVAILNWHELVNDTVAGVAVLVSYCPLCGTGMVFRREVGNQIKTFGVSGLLYRSDMLLYDWETESLWSQIASVAISGESMGTRLELLRSRHVRWGRWREEHPDTSVLSPRTGHRRDYARSPYRGYATSERLLFPVPRSARVDDRYGKKMPTLGIRTPAGDSRAYPASEVVAAGGRVREELGGRSVTVSYSAEEAEFDVTAPPAYEVIQGYWFAWLAFHPDSTVFVAPRPARAPVGVMY